MDSREPLRRVANAVIRGLEARAAFFSSRGIEDAQSLGSPAGPELIQRIETRVGHSLPPSCKAFLGLHNGWRMVDAETDLLAVEEMLGGTRAAKVKDWQLEAGEWGDQVAANGLVIGHSDLSQSRILLDPSTTSADGEWRLLERYKDEGVEYGSFLDWLERSVSDYEEFADPELSADDED